MSAYYFFQVPESVQVSIFLHYPVGELVIISALTLPKGEYACNKEYTSSS